VAPVRWHGPRGSEAPFAGRSCDIHRVGRLTHSASPNGLPHAGGDRPVRALSTATRGRHRAPLREARAPAPARCGQPGDPPRGRVELLPCGRCRRARLAGDRWPNARDGARVARTPASSELDQQLGHWPI
jgi:hypothetical protein